MPESMYQVQEIPSHLKRYIVEQNYERYTPIDQAVWRYTLRQLRKHLSVHGHEAYVQGLEKTGIEVERIPNVKEMSQKLEQFGWRAVSVSGFIPPAAFMEMQALSLLPIASDMRSIDHIFYTPAPDIVHEAAGHAPILVDPKFASYLKKYASVARKAIIGRQDLDLYVAIRDLSDVKENPTASAEDIARAEAALLSAVENLCYISEVNLLGRMNWWTAEYGLIGDVEQPKIFGAGLLSSIGESHSCLDEKVKKVPLTVDCVDFSYDITEPQPQLFVTPDFENLEKVLEALANRMAFRRGGHYGVMKAIESGTVNTVELNSGLQISGRLVGHETYYNRHGERFVGYISFSGPVQLCYKDNELQGHGVNYHQQGYGTAIGYLEGQKHCLSLASDADLKELGIEVGKTVTLKYQSGVVVRGQLQKRLRCENKLVVLSFSQCTVSLDGKELFRPEWGTYDLGIGSSIPSVFGGAADRVHYGETDDFEVKVVPRKQYSAKEQRLHTLYQMVRDIREAGGIDSRVGALSEIKQELDQDFQEEWLLRLEILEMVHNLSAQPAWSTELRKKLEGFVKNNARCGQQVELGLQLLA